MDWIANVDMSKVASLPPPLLKSDDTLVVAIDDGFADVKLVGETPDGALRQMVMPSSARSGQGIIDMHGGGMVGLYRTEEGESYTVSPNLPSEGNRFPDFHLSPLNRVLVMHALMQAGYSGHRVKLLTSLPVHEYFTANGPDRDRIERKRKNLRRMVHAMPLGRSMPDLIDVKVGCQAIAAFFDSCLDEDGDEIDRTLDARAIAVIDIGGSTTDIAVVLDGEQLDESRSGSAQIGVLDVHKRIGQALGRKYGTGSEFTAAALRQAVETKTFRVFGENDPCAEEVDPAIFEVEERIAREISRRIGNGAILDRILFVGGGAAVFKTLAQRYRNAVTPEEPSFANARGLLKYARYMARHG